MTARLIALLAPTLLLPTAAHAQQETAPVRPSAGAAADPELDEAEVEEVTVVGERERGAVPGDIRPEVQLSPADIRSYGVSSVADLLSELAPQTRSVRGRGGGGPVVLLNGRRVSSFAEIRDVPTEAIERVDVLPEEASLRLGYRADQRVVNFVLRRRFRAWTGEVAGGGSTNGDRYSATADASLLRIRRDQRLNVALRYEGATPVYEADRDVLPTTRLPSITGTVTPSAGASEIDPALSALAGTTVTSAGVPADVTGRPALSSFLGGVTQGDQSPFRTLSAATRSVSANATYSRNVLGTIVGSLNARFEATSSDSALGLATASYGVPASSPFTPFGTPVTVTRALVEGGPRLRQVEGTTAHLGGALNGDVGRWRWTFTSNYDRAFSSTFSDTGVDPTLLTSGIAAGTLNPFAPFPLNAIGDLRQDYARSLSSTLAAEMVASGPVLKLPAGDLVASLKSGASTAAFDGRSIRSGLVGASSLGRDQGNVQASFDLPIASRRSGVLDAIGNLSLNANAALDGVSDFGGLFTYGYGATWTPIDAIRLIGSVTDEQGAPSVAQLGNPLVITPDARAFDYVRGESVILTRVDGGNPGLLADNRHVAKLGLTLKPLKETDLSVTAEYVRQATDDVIATFPAATAAIEAAFPERIFRDPTSGQLLRIDARPINFDRREVQDFRWGFNFSKRIGPAPPPRPAGGFRRPQQPGGDGAAASGATVTPPQAEQRAGGDRPRGPGGFGGGRGGFGGGQFGGGRLQVALYHTWHLQDDVQIRPGLPTLDLLDGDAIGGTGGQPRHELELQAGVTRSGLGARLSGNWQSATRVTGGTPATPNDLRFGSLTTLNLRLFAQFTPAMKVVREHPWLRGTRVTLSVQNLLNQRLDVTDASGAVPVNFQPELLDPIGRSVRLSIRKLFF
jgi:iron complex outermembrane receptor protein